jgi:diguanylate cyclase (GGDEF)-like protein/PAS domain S-box-containing protein
LVACSKDRIARVPDRAHRPASPAATGDQRLTRLEPAALGAAEQLSLAIEALSEGLVLYDRDDRLVVCNQRSREIYAISADAMVQGARFADILRHGLERGQYAAAIGREEEWLVERLAAHRKPYSSHEQQLSDGRWLQVIEQATPEGGRIGLRIDITERKRQEAAAMASKRQLQATLAAIPDLLFEVDGNGRFLACHVGDPSRLLVPPETLLGKTLDAVLPADAVAAGRAAIDEARRSGRSTGHQYRLEMADGPRWFELSVAREPAATLPGDAPGVPRFIVLARDITERAQAESALRYNEALLRGLFELCPVGIALTDFATGAFIDVNEAVLAPLGYSRDELLGMTYFDITPEEYHAGDPRYLELLATDGRYGPYEKENIKKDGSRFPVLLSGTMVADLDGRKLIWSIVEDITERKAAEAQILRQAHYDELTGLPNRRLFQERLQGALERARRGRHIGAVAMLDLDDFKTVNDQLGHWAGDRVMVEAARRLGACTRATDTVARFGGDEFLVLLDDIARADDAQRIARKMRCELARPFTVEQHVLQLGVSIGICLFPADGDDADELLRLADMAMYRAKREGRNRVRFHSPGTSAAAAVPPGEPRRR